MKKISAACVLIAAVLFSVLLYTDFYRALDSRMYDLMLRIKPGIQENAHLLQLEIDDPVIAEVNVYPVPRNVFADGIMLAAEFNPAWIMFDIEFVDSSEDSIDFDYLTYGTAEDIEQTFADITAYQRQLVDLIISGAVSRDEAYSYLDDLENTEFELAQKLYTDLNSITYSRDQYLSSIVRYAGNVTATVNMVDEVSETIPQELREYTQNQFRINDYLTLNHDPFQKAEDILPSILPVLEPAAWAGFPRMSIDPDGVRRRVDLIYEHNGNYYTQLGFGTWWIQQGKPPITVEKGVLKVKDLKIPLDENGRMLLHWPRRLFDGTPLNRKDAANFNAENPAHRLSFFYLYYHDRLMDDLSLFLTELENYGIQSDRYGFQLMSDYIQQIEHTAQIIRATGDGELTAGFRALKETFLSEAELFLNSSAEQTALADLALAAETDPENSEYFAGLSAQTEYLFSESKIILEEIILYRNFLEERLTDAVVVAGYTGTSTSDYGANPFEKRYMNMGTYAVVYNSLLQGDFLRGISFRVTLIITLAAGLLVWLLSNIHRKNVLVNTLTGAAVLLLVIITGGAVFTVFGIYVHLLPLILTVLSAWLAAVIGHFIVTSREKMFIQGAFDQVISPDVVKKIRDNPAMLNIGGETRNITAMFSDIEAFSTISEKIGSSDKLFTLLKRYLTPMSDLILEEQGTIDKYEGDAIIAFWNAPLDQGDHANRACRAAVRMVTLEEQINKQLIEDGILTPEILEFLPHKRLFTRIGINTDVNNIGFIGTERRKDYTALGDGMNLAARLEGVNKTYGTQVMISEFTEQQIRGAFYNRRVDRIRVKGKELPVDIFELTGTPDPLHEKCYNAYKKALALFMAKEWTKAEGLFTQVLKYIPDDRPSQIFVDRCRQFRQNPPPDNWDGVHTMLTK